MREPLKITAEKFDPEGKSKIKGVGSVLASDFQHLGQATKDIATDSYGAVKDEFNDLYKQGHEKVTEVSKRLKGMSDLTQCRPC